MTEPTGARKKRGRPPVLFVTMGQRFGRGVVIDPGTRIPQGSRTARGVRLRCDCGNIYTTQIRSLISRHTQSCGCLQREWTSKLGRTTPGRPVTDRTGQRSGALVAVRLVGTEGGRARWLCRCDCGSELVVVGFPASTSCGCIRSRPKGGRAPGESSRKHVFDQYWRNAQRRGLPWEIDDADFDKLTSSDCHYCGQAPSGIYRGGAYAGGEFVYSGLDRLDNTGGYVPGNVVPCCADCNRAKSDMGYDEFVTWLARLTAHQWFNPDLLPSRLLREVSRPLGGDAC